MGTRPDDELEGSKYSRGNGIVANGRTYYPKPWERETGEPVQDFVSFTIYRDMASRTISGAAKILGESVDKISKLYHERSWEDRARAWDLELDRRFLRSEVSATKRMAARQVKLALGIQEAAALELRALIERIKVVDALAQESGEIRKPLIGAKTLVKLVECGTKLERLNKNVPNEIIENRNVIQQEDEDLSALTVEELEAYQALLDKIDGKSQK